jgi:transcriptional regulator with XRE-family HTH domain
MSTSLLPNYLKMHRKQHALAQHELAVLLGCENGSKVSRYERGQRAPTISSIMAYEIVFRERTHEG